MKYPRLFLQQIKDNWIPGSKTAGELAMGPREEVSSSVQNSPGSINHIQPTLPHLTYKPRVNWALQHQFQSQDESIYNT